MLMPSFLQRGRYTSVRTGIGPSENPLVSKMYTVSVFSFPWALSKVWLWCLFLYYVMVICSDVSKQITASVFRATELVQVHTEVMQ
jgi:hypothetical protein